jgi:hypothetical protein
VTTTNASTPVPVRLLVWALIAATGVLTVAACLFAAPVGVGITLANGVAAVLTHGPIRKAFATITVAGAALSIGLAVLVTGVSGVGGVDTVSQL